MDLAKVTCYFGSMRTVPLCKRAFFSFAVLMALVNCQDKAPAEIQGELLQTDFLVNCGRVSWCLGALKGPYSSIWHYKSSECHFPILSQKKKSSGDTGQTLPMTVFL